MHRHGFVLVAMMVLALDGCNRGPMQYTVSGKVTYQNEAVSQGIIIFSDVKGTDSAAVGSIKDGQYCVRTTAGQKSIRITATKKTGRMIDTMGIKTPELVDIIPPKFNTATTLTRNVPTDNATLDFRL